MQFLSLNGLLPKSRAIRAALRLSMSLELGPAADLAFFMNHEMRPFIGYEIDFDKLVASQTPIILAARRDSKHQYPYQASEIISDRLGRPFAELPGDHVGFTQHPRAFAAALGELLYREQTTAASSNNAKSPPERLDM